MSKRVVHWSSWDKLDSACSRLIPKGWHDNWKYVTCLRCLKLKPKRKAVRGK